jgi:hypothetical protein
VITKSVPVPGPTVTKPGPTVTVTESAPPPAAGAVIGTWRGTGNQTTPAFNVPDSGNYTVLWSYSGNTDSSFGSSSATNFMVDETTGGGESMGLPNNIAASGQGSTMVTGASGVDSFNVQAAGSWVITVKAA